MKGRRAVEGQVTPFSFPRKIWVDGVQQEFPCLPRTWRLYSGSRCQEDSLTTGRGESGGLVSEWWACWHSQRLEANRHRGEISSWFYWYFLSWWWEGPCYFLEKTENINRSIQDRVQVKILYGDRVGRMQGVKAAKKHRWMLVDKVGRRPGGWGR